MKVFVAGISGSNRDKYLEEVVKYAKEKYKKNMGFYSLGKLFLENAKKYFGNYDEDKILDLPFHKRAPVIGESFEQIMADMSSKKYDDVIIGCHAGFFWNKVFEKSFLWEKINKLDPDMFVTIIDASKDIKKRLSKRNQWKNQHLTEHEISLWQNVEVNDMEGIAEIRGKPSFVISTREPPSLLFKLMFKPEFEPVYASFPMTHYKEDTRKIDRFILKLGDFFAVFNPKSIEIGQRPISIVEKQTKKRDLDWYIGKVKRTIVYYPKWIASGGVISEMKETHERGKEVWAVMPKKRYGPFEKDYIDKMFHSQKEFFDFVERYIKSKKSGKPKEIARKISSVNKKR